ncbi:type VI secretion system protein TssA [Janthinobacterium sp.]|uniref:type VI secretion system protein TssA n=1 Tax=Janthinobacterium sp. TaxID=1871054 RepID=UPI00293D480D|nr:type VI secretion system protein TssA [Janthinobacterium sp.]
MFSADALLQPISAARPSGADLAFSPELDAIGLARRFDDPSLDQGEWVTELKEADWDFVARRCAALLTDTSKDLRLAVWLTEAGAKQWQTRGLGEGLLLLAGLCEQFWDLGLYPESEGEDHDQRIGNLSWILGRVPALLRDMPLTEGRDSAYSSIDFETARKLATLSDGARPPGGLKLADLEAARRNSSAQFNAALTADTLFCIDALKALELAADARLGMDSPGFSGAREALQNMLRTLPAAPAPIGAAPVSMSAGAGVDAAAPASAPQHEAQQSAPAGPAPSTRAPRRCSNYGWWRNSSATPSRTAQSPISPIRPPTPASRVCTPGCVRSSKTPARWRTSKSCSASSRARRRKRHRPLAAAGLTCAAGIYATGWMA